MSEAENSFSQPSMTLSKTGPTSASELLMARSTSDVAVCSSSASFVSLNSRTFSMAITAWSAKDCASAMSASLKGSGWSRWKASTPRPS